MKSESCFLHHFCCFTQRLVSGLIKLSLHGHAILYFHGVCKKYGWWISNLMIRVPWLWDRVEGWKYLDYASKCIHQYTVHDFMNLLRQDFTQITDWDTKIWNTLCNELSYVFNLHLLYIILYLQCVQGVGVRKFTILCVHTKWMTPKQN